MKMIKQYIKQILKENKFDNMELSLDLVEIMLDEAEETGEPVDYKGIEIDFHESEYGLISVYVEFKEKPKLAKDIFPYKNSVYLHKDETKESFIKRTFAIIKDHINFLEFETMFFSELKKRKYKFENNPIAFRKKIPYRDHNNLNNSILILLYNFHATDAYDDSIVILLNGIEYDSIVVRARKSISKEIRNANSIMQEFLQKLNKLENYLKNANESVLPEDLEEDYEND